MEKDSESSSLTVTPIGFVRTGKPSKFEVPHQPDPDGEDVATIELLPNREFDKALEDLAGFDRVWLVWWFHRNNTWKPKVQPPRGEEIKRGLFATRSPHRPNPIGISAVPLLSISGRTLTIGSCDLVDGTPILDIKPYVPSCDAFPDARTGWLAAVEAVYAAPPRFNIRMSPLADEQLAWLTARDVPVFERAFELLRRDPSENRSRRIKRHGENLFRMGCAEWRVFFSLHEDVVQIEYFKSGYALEVLNAPGNEVIPRRDCQVEFIQRWG